MWPPGVPPPEPTRADLGVHVTLVRGVDLAVDAERAAAEALPDADGRVPALAECELARSAVGEEGLARGGAHGVARIDGGAEIDQAGAPARGAEGSAERNAPESSCHEHAEPQGAVLRRAFRHSARRERREHQ